MRKNRILKYIILVALVFSAGLYFFPKVEEVEFTKYNTRFKNHLGITVNTKQGLFRGRESFLNFNRDYYSITLLTKGNEYPAKDIEITINGDTKGTIIPKNGTIKILENDSTRIVVKVNIADNRIPKLINGTYVISVADTNPEHTWYKNK
jgi:hypothetical protein